MVSRRLFRLAVCGCLGLAAAELSAAEAPPPIRLVAPVASTPLVGGADAEIAWEPLASFATLGEVEEWEAFLSLDGGTSYPFRLTPHLDRDLRRFRWRVPAVETNDARLLFRFGDERSEVPVLVPQRFAIAAPAIPAPFGDETFAIARRSPRVAGESALPGQRGVVGWVDGSRRGTRVRHVVGAGFGALAPTQALADTPHATDLERSQTPPRVAPSRGVVTAEQPTARSAAAPASAPPRPCADLLLLGQRRNE